MKTAEVAQNRDRRWVSKFFLYRWSPRKKMIDESNFRTKIRDNCKWANNLIINIHSKEFNELTNPKAKVKKAFRRSKQSSEELDAAYYK